MARRLLECLFAVVMVTGCSTGSKPPRVVCDGQVCRLACTSDTDCADGNVCDGTETCDLVSGECQPGTPLICDDGNPCNGSETCDFIYGCQPGTPMNCDDDNPCTTDSCDPSGGCQHVSLADGMTCTNGAGNNGSCQTGVCVVNCTENAQCDDGNVCNGIETCDTTTGKCQSGTVLSCSDGDVCNGVETCNAVTGCQPGTMLDCDDGESCTVDSCDVATGCQHSSEADGTTCVDGAGNNGSCQSGACVVDCVVNADCDDGNVCNGMETCDMANGTCQAGTPPSCDDGNDCTTDACDAAGGCQHTSLGDGTTCTTDAGTNGTCLGGTCLKTCATNGDCDDGIPCTTDSCDLATHTCMHQPSSSSCNDNNDCTTDTCDPTSGCTYVPVADGTTCQRRYYEFGQCVSGTCQ